MRIQENRLHRSGGSACQPDLARRGADPARCLAAAFARGDNLAAALTSDRDHVTGSRYVAWMKNPGWTNPSVKLLAGESDPVQVITERARALTLQMIELGWPGPPFDPLWVAQVLGVEVVPVADAPDARTVPTDAGDLGVRIEYNPSRPTSRRRFSMAHEIGHLLFPDVAKATRHRATLDRAQSDDWQLELLCNVAAGEITMPVGSFEDLDDQHLNMRVILELRSKLDVSFEALLLRVTKLTDQPLALVATSRESPTDLEPFRLDYALGSRGWLGPLPRRGRVASKGLVDCTAVGFTSSADNVQWPGLEAPAAVECVGVPPFPGHRWPRVLGLLLGRRTQPTATLRVVFGDATSPMGPPPRIIAHIVNDRARAWHGGFAAALGRRFPAARDNYVNQRRSERVALGANVLSEVDDNTAIVSLVAQAGYGPSKKPRIRYQALESCLAQLATEAIDRGASVHMPRIGTGQAGGRWSTISGLIDEELVARGCWVTIYDLPWQVETVSQQELDL